MPVGHLRWAAINSASSVANSSFSSKGGSISTSPRRSLGGHIGAQRVPAVDRQGLAARIAADDLDEPLVGLRVQFGGDQPVVGPHRLPAEPGRAGIGLRPIKRAGAGQSASRHGFSRASTVGRQRRTVEPCDAVLPFMGAQRLFRAEIVASRAGMGVDDAIGRFLRRRDGSGCASTTTCLRTSAKFPAWKPWR